MAPIRCVWLIDRRHLPRGVTGKSLDRFGTPCKDGFTVVRVRRVPEQGRCSALINNKSLEKHHMKQLMRNVMAIAVAEGCAALAHAAENPEQISQIGTVYMPWGGRKRPGMPTAAFRTIPARSSRQPLTTLRTQASARSIRQRKAAVFHIQSEYGSARGQAHRRHAGLAALVRDFPYGRLSVPPDGGLSRVFTAKRH